MSEFEAYKKKFFDFLNRISDKDKIAVIAHGNCLDGMSSSVFLLEILKKKFPLMSRPIMHFIPYSIGGIDKLKEGFRKEKITKIFILDLNADADMLDEFNRLKEEFDVLFVDHHPLNPDLKIDEKVIKTKSDDCTTLMIYRFGEGIINEKDWIWLACSTAVSEFSYKNRDNFDFIKKYYPDFNSENVQKTKIFEIVSKLGSVVTYYAKDSLKAYELILNKDFEKIDLIHKEFSIEFDRCKKDFEVNSEKYFDKHLYFYFLKSKFNISSAISTSLSVKYKDSTVIVFYEPEGTNLIKVSARNNGVPLKYSMNDLVKAGISGLEGAIGGGHAPASGASFLKRDIETFKKQVIEFVRTKIA